jgi:glyoxylase-like metal-dependent hydrolase (beta-lactamase superfamily II)
MRKAGFLTGFLIFFASALFCMTEDNLVITRLTGAIHKITYNPPYPMVQLASIGEDGILLIDTGFPETAAELHGKLKKAGNGRLVYVINTHAHDDHIGGNSLFDKEAVLIAHSNAAKRFNRPYFHLRSATSRKPPDITFDDALTLHFNGQTIHLIHMPNGHSDGDLVVHFPADDIVYVADLIIPGRFSTVDTSMGGNVDGYLKNLKALMDQYPKGTRFFPSHGREYSWNELHEYYRAFVDTAPQIEEMLKAGKSVDFILESGIFAPYSDWIRMRDWVEVLRERVYPDSRISICEPMTRIIRENGAAAAIELYHRLKEEKPDGYNFDEDQLNRLGYHLLGLKRTDEALAVFKLNISAYPQSANAYDSYGEACLEAGKKEDAVAYFKKSLNLDPGNSNARQHLDRLLKKK